MSQCIVSYSHTRKYETTIWLRRNCNTDCATKICDIEIFRYNCLPTQRPKLILIGKCIKFRWHRYNVSLMGLMRQAIETVSRIYKFKQKRYAYFFFFKLMILRYSIFALHSFFVAFKSYDFKCPVKYLQRKIYIIFFYYYLYSFNNG